ncbi:phosphoenolpyruvate carboxylase kinase 1-like [Aristolochia californica]|uniref:phosphoenolpyruvate carboxylase kinase 1-like n=1 Tax=Aristolochia californica TaxID=171875 RepID=UPI0035D86291
MSEALKRDYQICEEIGRGRFGTVFRCFSPVSGEFFACKSIDKGLLSDAIDRECLEKEAKILHLVSGNPNVIQIFEVYEDEDALHMVFELCPSPDLFDRISKRIFSETEAAAVMSALMEAIAHCHSRGVAHRDIKPDNILFDDRNRLKLADFGSADCFGVGRPLRGIVGTPYYVAPEVVAGREYNEKVDVWSAGVILYIMLAGIPPFYGDSAAEIFEVVLRGNLRFPTRLFHSISPTAKDLIRRMLCKDVSRRFSAEQVLRHPWMTSGGAVGSVDDLT